jgi:hypothetical protein
LLVSGDQGLTFQTQAVSHPMPFTAIDALSRRSLVLAGLQGIDVEPVGAERTATSNEVLQ